MKRISLAGIALIFGMFMSCQNNPDTSGTTSTDGDTVHTGLEGTRDQAGQLSTDVKPDTSSGQATSGLTTDKDSSGRSTTAVNDEAFVKEQIAGNYDEIALSKAALTQSSDKELKKIANHLISDHTAALGKLKKLSAAGKTQVVSAASDDAKATLSSLQTSKGKAFDKVWCETQIEKHKTTISTYEAAAKSVSDSDTKGFITETLPKLRMHLDELMAYHGKIKAFGE